MNTSKCFLAVALGDHFVFELQDLVQFVDHKRFLHECPFILDELLGMKFVRDLDRMLQYFLTHHMDIKSVKAIEPSFYDAPFLMSEVYYQCFARTLPLV